MELNFENNIFDNEEELFGEEKPQEVTEKEEETITEINQEELFTDSLESVGNEENKQEDEDTEPEKKGTSPNVFSSIAYALKEESVFQTLEDNDLESVKGADDFRDLLEKEISNRFDEELKRIKDALDYGIEPNVIKLYENAIKQLNSITDEHILDETEKGENLRKSLIYQDFINKGFKHERALKEVEKAFNSGDDIEIAKEALVDNKEYLKDNYNELLEEKKQENLEQEKILKKLAEEFKKLITETKEPFKGLTIDSNTKKKIFDVITKPVYKDDNGNMYTEILKYEKDNKAKFLYNLGLIYTLTDGFKDLSKLVGKQVNKETKNKLKELEHTLNSSTLGGKLDFMGAFEEEAEGFNGMRLNV